MLNPKNKKRMRKVSSLIALALVAWMIPQVGSGNNLRIWNVVNTNPGSANPIIQFNLAWDNTWKVTTGPSNWDAAWIFVKYQRVPVNSPQCESYLKWNHAKMLNNDTAFKIITSGVPMVFEYVSDSVGVFIRPNSDTIAASTGTMTVQIRLRLPVAGGLYSPIYNFRVFGLEMVYIPTGAFELGDGASAYTFNSIYVDAAAVSSSWTPAFVGGGIANTIPQAFPKGYYAFYCMKYEITQGQWVDFLNTLTYDQQKARTGLTDAQMTTNPGVSGLCVYSNCGNRNGVKLGTPGINNSKPAVFVNDLTSAPGDPFNSANDGQNIAMNFLSATDFYSYLDWAGLRPMTNFEFEKVARGAGQMMRVPYEYIWGSANQITQAHSGALFNAGTPSEISQTSGPGLAAFWGGASAGPLRVGFSATSSTNRLTSGSSFYGVQNLGGNVYEIVWGGRNYSGNGYNLTYYDLGDGELSSGGSYNVNNWSIYDGYYHSGGGRYIWRFELRGGAYNSSATELRTSDRSVNNGDDGHYYYGYGNTPHESRNSTYGGRGVR